MAIPDKQHCFRLMRKMGMLEHIAAHSVQVCRVALSLAALMKSTRADLDPQLLQAASLLHDITKTRSFDTGENHAETGAAFLVELGFTEVGELVRQHVRLDSYQADQPIGHAAILNYSDKRVLHDAIVSLDERMQYILERYGETAVHRQRIGKLWQVTTALEDLIFKPLSISPSDLTDWLTDIRMDFDLDKYRQAARLGSQKDRRIGG